jgi:hypothetical protein
MLRIHKFGIGAYRPLIIWNLDRCYFLQYPPWLASQTMLSSSNAIHSADDILRLFYWRNPPLFVVRLFFFPIPGFVIAIRRPWHVSITGHTEANSLHCLGALPKKLFATEFCLFLSVFRVGDSRQFFFTSTASGRRRSGGGMSFPILHEHSPLESATVFLNSSITFYVNFHTPPTRFSIPPSQNDSIFLIRCILLRITRFTCESLSDSGTRSFLSLSL